MYLGAWLKKKNAALRYILLSYFILTSIIFIKEEQTEKLLRQSKDRNSEVEQNIAKG